MKRHSMIALTCLAACSLASGDGRRSSVQKSQGVDKTPPSVVLTVPGIAPLTFPAHVSADDENGISKVFLAIDGAIVQGRVQPPYEFTVTASILPIEVCALVEDTHGNSSMDCKVVQGRQPTGCSDNTACAAGEFCLKPPGDCSGSGTCTQRSESCTGVFDPVCGCDGLVYSNECLAHSAGVSVAHNGSCEISLAQFILDVTPAELTSCTDQLQLSARVQTTGGIPVPGVLVIFNETPNSTLTGTFTPSGQLLSDASGVATVVWRPGVAQCFQECTTVGDPNSGACTLAFTAGDITAAFESVPVLIIDSIP